MKVEGQRRRSILLIPYRCRCYCSRYCPLIAKMPVIAALSNLRKGAILLPIISTQMTTKISKYAPTERMHWLAEGLAHLGPGAIRPLVSG